MKNRKRGVILVFIVLLAFASFVDAASITYKESDINSVKPNLPIVNIAKDRYFADYITGAKLCIELSSGQYPILEDFGYPKESSCTSTWKFYAWDFDNSKWIDKGCHFYQGDTCKDSPEIKTLTCRTKNTGEKTPFEIPVSEIVVLNDIYTNKSDNVPDYDFTDIRFSADVLTGKKLCELKGYEDLINFALHVYCTPGTRKINYFWSLIDWDSMSLSSTNSYSWIATAPGLTTNQLKCKKKSDCKTCVDYPGLCGNSLDNGCGGTIDCGCLSGYHCNNLTSGNCIPDTLACSNENQIIMKLSQPINSLGALWNNTNFEYSICYDHIFQENYAGTNPHDCTGYNKILNLQQTSNSVAEIPILINYNIPICFGNLVCHNEISPGDNCIDSNEKIILRLNNETNSHISNRTDTNYTIKICCRKSALGNASWENMNEMQITSADISDSVKLVVKGEVQSRTINYTIKKQGELSWNPLNWFPRKVAQTSAKGFAVWKTTEAGSFYFIAQILNENGYVLRQIDSRNEPNDVGILAVEGYSNTIPLTQIIKPVNETNYVLNYIISESRDSTNTISFEQISSDEDDDLSATWNFGDGNITSLTNCFTGRNCNTTHVYTSTGTKLIGLTMTENTRGQQARDFSRIYVYKKGLNIFSIIDEPNYKISIKGGGIFRIDGRSSHIANCSLTFNECKLSSNNCYQVNDSIDPLIHLWCYRYKESNALSFKWTFDPGTSREKVKDTNNEPFDEAFTETGDYIIKLRVSYTLS